MKSVQYIILLLLAVAGIVVGLNYATDLNSSTGDDGPKEAGVKPPSDRPLRSLFEQELYTDKIAFITPRERSILLDHSDVYRLKPLFEPQEILAPSWKDGELVATISCRVADFPREGTDSLLTFRMLNIEGTWFCDLFSSESHRLFALFNVLEHPVGLLLTYFNCDDIPYRRSYIAEDATNPDRLSVTASDTPIPHAGSTLVSIDSFEYAENGICMAAITVSRQQGHSAQRKVYLKSFLGKWFLWRDPPQSVLEAL